VILNGKTFGEVAQATRPGLRVPDGQSAGFITLRGAAKPTFGEVAQSVRAQDS
jgi:hypothetical protein